jgi:asparagine synthase (glutamine-hydrolysing)
LHLYFICLPLHTDRIMCGFTGWVDSDPQSIQTLEKMTETMISRGPDASGLFLKGTVGLGHRRLSIIDIEGSQQPMLSLDGRYALSYNGEVYNFRELREELISIGRSFQTKGDTEVVLHALIVWGEEAIARFSGMFAFAFWDRDTETLLLARDHLGVKPLYIYRDAKRIVFGSEIKAILAHPAVSREINPNAIGLYLECQYIPAPETIYQKIQKVPPAYVLRYQRGCLDQRCYWTPSYYPKWDCSEEEAIEMLEKELRRSVRSMLVSDVPVGAFVSGGIDSSLIAALMQQESGKKTEMFSIALNHTHGEQQHAARVAEYLGASFHPLVVTAGDLMGALDHMFDEPFGDQAALPTLLLSKLTRKHVKVVLTGEGADEIFAGYSNYPKRLRDARLCARLHATPLPYLYPLLPAKLRKSRICKAFARPLSRRYTTIPTLFCREIYRSLLTRPFLNAQTNSLEHFAEGYFYECDSEEYLDKMLHIDTRLWLADDLLTKVDSSTMAYSLEARVPYLDYRLVEFAARLPPQFKLRGFEGKILLKMLSSRGLLPQEIANRPKWGFVMPLGDWLAKDLKPVVDDALSESGLLGRNIFQKKSIVKLRDQTKKSDAMRLFSLLSLELWFRKNAPEYRFSGGR